MRRAPRACPELRTQGFGGRCGAHARQEQDTCKHRLGGRWDWPCLSVSDCQAGEVGNTARSWVLTEISSPGNVPLCGWGERHVLQSLFNEDQGIEDRVERNQGWEVSPARGAVTMPRAEQPAPCPTTPGVATGITPSCPRRVGNSGRAPMSREGYEGTSGFSRAGSTTLDTQPSDHAIRDGPKGAAASPHGGFFFKIWKRWEETRGALDRGAPGWRYLIRRARGAPAACHVDISLGHHAIRPAAESGRGGPETLSPSVPSLPRTAKRGAPSLSVPFFKLAQVRPARGKLVWRDQTAPAVEPGRFAVLPSLGGRIQRGIGRLDNVGWACTILWSCVPGRGRLCPASPATLPEGDVRRKRGLHGSSVAVNGDKMSSSRGALCTSHRMSPRTRAPKI